MAITDLRFAANLLKEGFTAEEVRTIIGMKSNSPTPDPGSDQEPTPDPTPDPGSDQEPTPDPTPDPGSDQEPEPDPGSDQEPEPDPEPEKKKEKQNPLTRNENPKKETLVDALAKLL